MRIFRRVGALALTVALLATWAGAAGLPAANVYPGFADVPGGTWYAQGVQTCYEAGLMNGTDNGFQPEGLVSLAQAATIAARLHSLLGGGDGVIANPEGTPWYTGAVSYLAQLGVDVAQPEKTATRAEFFSLLASVATAELLSPINTIEALPDVDGGDPVLGFYNAGILTGTDEYGTFNGGGELSRAECAVMVARLADPSQRKHFTPAKGPDAGMDGDTALTVNGRAVSLTEYKSLLLSRIYRTDYSLYQQGIKMDWDTDYGVGDLALFFLDQAVGTAVQYALLRDTARELGCEMTAVAGLLFPDPGAKALADYALREDYLCAAHILVSDPDTAQAVLDGLKSVPTLEQFNALLYVFGEDPGMASNPNGYLFSAGEMVPEFEAAVRALDIGAYTTEPVQSTYGYHIIWRLDPAEHPELLANYQNELLMAQLDRQAEQAQVEVNEEAILSIDVPSSYSAYLSQLAAQQN